ncbi:hypothetical protein SteCoe_508 [Stentor coeruleus]|uniref:GOLD domain-containing protein n=1 Tax=Stentor coeruleus TaxID=5963 RepID=A0A1R2D3W5_9CILI|nr:hypothetical protein SteCoe_508 [Stentor coeruleus]
MKTYLLLTSCLAMFFTLPGYMEYCFTIDGKASRKIWGAYVISGEGDMNVLTRFFNSQRKAKYTSQVNTREGKFEESIDKDETYEMCFKSQDGIEKIISFEFSQDMQIEEQSLAAEDHFQPLDDEIASSSQLLDTVYRNLHFYERRESAHRDLTERTCDYILLSVLIKIVVLCTLSLLQIYVLKNMFSSVKTSV